MTTLTSCTVSDNTGAGLYASTGTAKLIDTIVAGNTKSSVASDIVGFVGFGIDSSSSYNLIGPGGSGGLANGVNNNIVLTSLADLGLAGLGNYGGPTQTMALLPGSAAVGKGTQANYPGTSNPITTDQRGFALDDPVDIGAAQLGEVLMVQSTDGGLEQPAPTVDPAQCGQPGEPRPKCCDHVRPHRFFQP